jgi:hypothetical protein
MSTVEDATDGELVAHAGSIEAPGPDRAAFDAVALVRFKREHGRWPSVDEAIAVTGSSLVIGRTGLEGSIVLPEDPMRAWHEWANAEAEARHQRLLDRMEENRLRAEERHDEFVAEMRAWAVELGLTRGPSDA